MLPCLEETNSTITPIAKAVWFNDLEKILVEILQIISQKKDAELSLQYESLQMVQDAMGDTDLEQMVHYTRFLVEFGMQLAISLQRLGAYMNGRLMYEYKAMQGESIILEHVLFNPSSDEDVHVSP